MHRCEAVSLTASMSQISLDTRTCSERTSNLNIWSTGFLSLNKCKTPKFLLYFRRSIDLYGPSLCQDVPMSPSKNLPSSLLGTSEHSIWVTIFAPCFLMRTLVTLFLGTMPQNETHLVREHSFINKESSLTYLKLYYQFFYFCNHYNHLW